MASSAAGRASHLAHGALRYALPVGAAGCFAFAGYDVWRVSSGSTDEAALRARWAKDARELDGKRVAWSASVAKSYAATPERKPQIAGAEAAQEVHNMDALGPAGLRLKKGETVDILEEGSGMEVGFCVVRTAAGAIGIYPKQYLQLPGALAAAAAAAEAGGEASGAAAAVGALAPAPAAAAAAAAAARSE
eukprot:TRINITY_DN42952_c0_g1_i1.p2 TRINITY_DN42952_c0_g1~~TRINITY_DN42952_c0_g1_i1.p2  ORF type:complete len:191 (+),score=53.48 TRINITY_DN42952_c0_g1_i1:138-710(+)